MRPSMGRGVLASALLVGALAGCSEDRAGTEASTASTGPSEAAEECRADLLACARATSIGSLVPDQATEATGEPIVLGMINQENTPVGSFPELSTATRAAVEFVNHEMGGVGGRPLQVEVCNTGFSPEGSTACAQQFVTAGVPAVLGGIDVFGNGIDTLEENGVPYVGGIPVSQQSVTAANSFQWSGGTWGATVAFAHHAAADLDAATVAIVYGDFGPIGDSARYGETTLRSHGVDDVLLVPYPITATDLTSPIQAAAAADPDAMIVLAADTGCAGAYDGVATAGVEVPVFYVGACASPAIVEQAGPDKTEGAIFNVEGPVDAENPEADFLLYAAVLDEYGDGLEPAGAGTVTFRSLMNLYGVLAGLDADAVDPAAITEALRAQTGAPSFMGHDYTCDGRQLEGLPALCSPQQILVQLQDGELTQLGDWIDVGEIYGGG